MHMWMALTATNWGQKEGIVGVVHTLMLLITSEDEGHSRPAALPGVVVLLSKGRLLLCSEPAICPLSQTLTPILHIVQ